MNNAKDIKVGITLTGDSSGLRSEVKVTDKDFDKLKASAAGAGESASQSFTKMSTAQADYSRKSTAFKNLEIRSTKDIKREISLVQASYKRLASSGTASASDLSRASSATANKVASLREELDGTTKSTGNFGASVRRLVGVAAVFYGIRRGVNASEAAVIRNQSAILGLSSIAKHAGVDIEETLVKSLELSADGMMTNAQAAKALQNLLARGFSLQESLDMINRFRDSAAFGRQASLGFGEAVVTATEGIKNENSILVDNAGVTKNVSMMWKEYATQLGVGANSLTIVQKRQAEYNGIMRETEGQIGNAAKASAGLQGAQARMSKATDDAATSFGKALTPALTEYYNAGTKVLSLVKELPQYLPEIATGLTAIGVQAIVARTGLAAATITMGTAAVAARTLAKALLPLAAAEGALKVFELGSVAVDAYAASQNLAVSKENRFQSALQVKTKLFKEHREEIKALGLDLNALSGKMSKEDYADKVTAFVTAFNRAKREAAGGIAVKGSVAAPITATKAVPLDPKAVAKSLKEAEALTASLEASFDDAFTKTKKKYSSTWETLVATHGAGSAQVKKLESAYQSYLDTYRAKEVAAEKVKTDKIVSLQSAKYARMNQRAAEAAASDEDRVGMQLTNDLKAMADERQRLVDQKVWNEELEIAYDEARISRAQETADALSILSEEEDEKKLQRLIDGETAAYELKGQFQQLVSDNQLVNLNAMAGNLGAYAKASADWDKWTGDQKLGLVAATFGAVSGLMASESRKQFEIGKAGAQSENAVNTYLGATKAYQAMAGIPVVGPALGIAAAGAITLAGVANSAKISSASFGSGASGAVSMPTISATGSGAAPTVAMDSNTGLPVTQAAAKQQEIQPINVYMMVSGAISEEELIQKGAEAAIDNLDTEINVNHRIVINPRSPQGQLLAEAA